MNEFTNAVATLARLLAVGGSLGLLLVGICLLAAPDALMRVAGWAVGLFLGFGFAGLLLPSLKSKKK